MDCYKLFLVLFLDGEWLNVLWIFMIFGLWVILFVVMCRFLIIGWNLWVRCFMFWIVRSNFWYSWGLLSRSLSVLLVLLSCLVNVFSWLVILLMVLRDDCKLVIIVVLFLLRGLVNFCRLLRFVLVLFIVIWNELIECWVWLSVNLVLVINEGKLVIVFLMLVWIWLFLMIFWIFNIILLKCLIVVFVVVVSEWILLKKVCKLFFLFCKVVLIVFVKMVIFFFVLLNFLRVWLNVGNVFLLNVLRVVLILVFKFIMLMIVLFKVVIGFLVMCVFMNILLLCIRLLCFFLLLGMNFSMGLLINDEFLIK